VVISNSTCASNRAKAHNYATIDTSRHPDRYATDSDVGNSIDLRRVPAACPLLRLKAFLDASGRPSGRLPFCLGGLPNCLPLETYRPILLERRGKTKTASGSRALGRHGRSCLSTSLVAWDKDLAPGHMASADLPTWMLAARGGLRIMRCRI